MSIHPEFARRILRGEKLVEFRRRPLARQATHIVIYATAPISAVVGVAEVERVQQASPSELWRMFQRVGGIRKEDFFAYFAGASQGFAYLLKQAQTCDVPIALGQAGLPERAPQAFQYLEAPTLNAVLESSSHNANGGARWLTGH